MEFDPWLKFAVIRENAERTVFGINIGKSGKIGIDVLRAFPDRRGVPVNVYQSGSCAENGEISEIRDHLRAEAKSDIRLPAKIVRARGTRCARSEAQPLNKHSEFRIGIILFVKYIADQRKVFDQIL